MKIAMTHVDLPNESKGGVAQQAHHLSNTLVQRGHDVTMFSFSPAFADCLYQVHQYSKPRRFRKLSPFLFAAALAKTDFSGFDVIHTHGDNYLLWGRHPQVRTFNGSAIDEARAAVSLRHRTFQTVHIGLEDIGAKVADICVGISRATQQRIPAVSKIIACGVDLTHFSPGVKSPAPTILFVGTTSGRKRGAFLAEIFTQQIRPRFPDVELWAVTDRPMVGEGIVNLGKQVPFAELCALYQRAWILCLPSTYEGFGIPYIEAMASGTVAVASPNPGAKEILDDGKYGVIAEDAELGNALNRLLADRDLRQSWIEKGLQRVQQYRWEHVAEQYENVYRSML